ncbi:MAG: CBS domain-containing protein [Acidimicrobiales bacterium]
MRVAEILRRKGTHTETVARSDTVGRAVEILREHGFGALVVSDDGQSIDGIISERDVVRALGLRADLLDIPVSEIMTEKVFTCTPADQIEDLMSMMTEKRIRHLPVSVDGVLSGLVSIGDVVKYRVSELEDETHVMQEYIQHGR